MFKKLMAGVVLAAISVTAIVPATVSAASGTTIVDKAIKVNSRTGDFDTLLTAATCDYLDGAVVDVLSDIRASDQGIIHVIQKVMTPPALG